jgi:hypothetical protein
MQSRVGEINFDAFREVFEIGKVQQGLIATLFRSTYPDFPH